MLCLWTRKMLIVTSALSMSYLTVLFFTNSLNIKNLKVARSII